ncbi:hypothetical protein [Vibrio campbellii]|uniref:LicD family protein n=1 Tax=Vibrio campbellii TaxID=680 RepID=A0ABY5ICR8_9VIBR|nr:hypothetical protein [Vibrio campbellii]UTZ20553.1 hypothetical protein HB760_00765 [Vibrio campbellii]UTZ32093.1 hypothetical protein HB762_12095 [Vibrio campbellii]
MLLKRIEHFLKNLALVKRLRAKRKKTKKNNELPKNQAHLADEVLCLVRNIEPSIYPMFGTLLSIYRDSEFKFADDFDFAVNDKSLFSHDLIDKFESHGAKLTSISTVNNHLDIVELSFNFKGAKVDLFYIDNDDNYSIHRCPNFRTNKNTPKKSFKDGLKFKIYESYFEVKYPKIALSVDKNFNISIPNDPVSIFERHYGLDWATPKLTNFIDFKYYKFVECESSTISGSSKNLKRYFKKAILES